MKKSKNMVNGKRKKNVYPISAFAILNEIDKLCYGKIRKWFIEIKCYHMLDYNLFNKYLHYFCSLKYFYLQGHNQWMDQTVKQIFNIK